jgi:very-short-patch-repair endonuclease
LNFGVYNPLKSEIIKNKVKETKINNLIQKYKNLNIIEIDYVKQQYKFKCDCGENHDFFISSTLLYNRLKIKTKLCTVCNKINSYSNSGLQIQLQEFIEENYDGIIELNNRKLISPNEIDIYLPELKLAFEFDGVFWHNETNKPKNYHLNKTEMCEKLGIHLIHIYEDDWVYKQEIVKSRILNLLGKTPNKIYARKCVIKKITGDSIKPFLEKNHLQGFVGSRIKLGLFYNDELVSLMTFGEQRKAMGVRSKENVYEMIRFCNKNYTNVIGGGNKLFKYFLNNYKPVEVISYADRSWSLGDLYKKLGFEYISKTPINYYYVVDGIRSHRFNFRKDKLVRDGYDSTKSEHEIMLDRNIYRIYDCGCLKFKYSNNI